MPPEIELIVPRDVFDAARGSQGLLVRGVANESISATALVREDDGGPTGRWFASTVQVFGGGLILLAWPPLASNLRENLAARRMGDQR